MLRPLLYRQPTPLYHQPTAFCHQPRRFPVSQRHCSPPINGNIWLVGQGAPPGLVELTGHTPAGDQLPVQFA